MSKRTLILSCNTGQGHNSCANAIQEIYQANGDDCDIKDALAFIAVWVSKAISGGHVFIYRHLPGLFRGGYRFSERHPALFENNSAVYHLLTCGTKQLYACITEGGYDTVICTHVFASLMLTETIRRHPDLTLSTSLVATDYTCSPGVENSLVNWYFIPDGTLADDFGLADVPATRMVGSGIPVRQMFYRHTDRSVAKAAEGINPDHQHLLMMCGSMGCGPMTDLAKSLAGCLPDTCEMTIVCGTNARLQRRLEHRYGQQPNVHVRGYVTDISRLMDSADLYLTKPGGISVTEAAVKHLPMVFVDAVAGCEEYNRRFFIDSGCAATGETTEQLTAVCLSLLRDKQALADMEQNLRQHALPNAACMIYSYTKDFAEHEH